MSSNNNNNNNQGRPVEEEGILAHITRVCKNTCTKCFGCIQTSDEYAKIKYKEYMIEQRQKTFGVDYYHLLTIVPPSTPEMKQQCIDTVLHDIHSLQCEIDVLQQEIDRVNQTTRDKIIVVTSPSSGGNASTSGTTTTTKSTTTTDTTTSNPTTTATAMETAVVPVPVVPTTTTTTTTTTEDPTMMQEIPLTTDETMVTTTTTPATTMNQ